MKTTQHTDGPWEVSPYNNITSKNGTIAKTEQMPSNDEAERKANARLIAAAPELLEACKAIVEQWEEETRQTPLALNRHPHGLTIHAESVRLRKQARAAIAKAEGVE